MRKKEMIDAARTVFARNGFANSTLEDVAELAEFGKGTLYNYFPNKEALFAGVLEDTFMGFYRIFEAVLSSDGSFETKIENLIEQSLRYAFGNPEGIILMSRESQHLRENNPLMQLLPKLVGLLAETISAEQEATGRLIDAQPPQLARILMNMVMGQFMSRLHAVAFPESSDENGMPCVGLLDDVLNSLKDPSKIEEDVRQTTELIHQVFLFGITNR